MTYLVTDGKQKLLFTGDTLFSVAVGSTNFNTSSIKDLIKSLRKIDKLEYDEMYSGHGSSSTKERQTKNIARWIDILKQELKLDRKNFIVYE